MQFSERRYSKHLKLLLKFTQFLIIDQLCFFHNSSQTRCMSVYCLKKVHCYFRYCTCSLYCSSMRLNEKIAENSGSLSQQFSQKTKNNRPLVVYAHKLLNWPLACGDYFVDHLVTNQLLRQFL